MKILEFFKTFLRKILEMLENILQMIGILSKSSKCFRIFQIA